MAFGRHDSRRRRAVGGFSWPARARRAPPRSAARRERRLRRRPPPSSTGMPRARRDRRRLGTSRCWRQGQARPRTWTRGYRSPLPLPVGVRSPPSPEPPTDPRRVAPTARRFSITPPRTTRSTGDVAERPTPKEREQHDRSCAGRGRPVASCRWCGHGVRTRDGARRLCGRGPHFRPRDRRAAPPELPDRDSTGVGDRHGRCRARAAVRQGQSPDDGL